MFEVLPRNEVKFPCFFFYCGQLTTKLGCCKQVNSEFYTGWLDYWGGGHAHGDTTAIIKTLTEMMDMVANVNM